MNEESNAQPLFTVLQIQEAIGSAAWNWNLDRFLNALDWTEDTYTTDKFRQFQELARALGNFDDTLLERIIVSYHIQRKERENILRGQSKLPGVK